jgi:DUF1707 SHOCT-like domain
MSHEIVPSGSPEANLRMSDRDRERVVTRLNDAVAEGRLTIDEFEERISGVLAAKTFGEVQPYVSDLPAVPMATPVEETRLTARGSNITRDGRWVVPARLRIEARGSRVRLDYTQAVVHTSTVCLDVRAHGANLQLIVLPGMSVDLGGVSMHGSRVRSRNVNDQADPGAVHIVVTGEAHGSSVTARIPRAWRWPWEKRSPLDAALGR